MAEEEEGERKRLCDTFSSRCGMVGDHAMRTNCPGSLSFVVKRVIFLGGGGSGGETRSASWVSCFARAVSVARWPGWARVRRMRCTVVRRGIAVRIMPSSLLINGKIIPYVQT